jgi:hypothetical protein
LFRHHDLCRHSFSHRKHHPTRDCKCVLGDEASVVPFRKEVRQRQELRIIQAVAILHGCPKLLMPSSLLERSTPQTSPVTRSPPFRLPKSHVLDRPRSIIISLRVQESRTVKLAGTLSGSAPILSLCSLRWQGGLQSEPFSKLYSPLSKSSCSWTWDFPYHFAKLPLTSEVDLAEV